MALVESVPKLNGKLGAPGHRTQRPRVRVLPALTLLTLVVGVGGWIWARTHPSEDPTGTLLTATVTRGDLAESVSATGSITAQTGAMVKIGSQITGRIKRLYADVGSTVKAGQVIAELDLPDIQAQLDQAEGNREGALTRLIQQETGVPLTRAQMDAAVAQARAALHSAQQRLAAAQAAASQQSTQTPTDIRRAQTGVAVARAALSTAQANLVQIQAGADLQVATAQAQLRQAQANAHNSALNLQRQQALLGRGFVPASTVDDAQATAAVNQAQVDAAQQNVQLVRQKVTADLQSARDQVAQARQNVEAAQAALAAAQAETYQDAAKQANVQDARAQIRQAQANLEGALANLTSNRLKQQDVEQAREALRVAQAQVDYARAQVAKTVIRSPINGTVLQLAAQQGETLAAGLAAPTLIIVANLDRLQADAFVDETDIGQVRLGQEADVTVDAFPEHAIKGRVTKIASGSTIQQGIVTYDVTIALRDPGHRLKPDMSASIAIQTGRRTNALLVPAVAVKIDLQGTTVNIVATRNGKTATTTRRVRTDGSDGVNTVILEGLREGETVVLAGLQKSGQTPGGFSPFGPGMGGGRR